MQNSMLFTTLILLVMTISSCKLDSGGILNPSDKTEPIILEDRYDTDVTLTNHNEDGVDYIATDRIQVFGGKMTIEAGVTIEFEEGTYLVIGIEGRLDAIGTSGEPIRMIAEENEPSWAGIYINTNKANKIHHCIIANAGVGKTHGVFNDFAAAITLDGKVSIENTTISSSGDVGFKINGTSEHEVSSFDGNTIKDCEGFPILTNINFLDELNLADNIFTDNGKNMIGVDDRHADRLTTATTLDALEVPYFFTGEFDLFEDLTLNKGVELIMDSNSFIDHSASGGFRFQIKGTEDDHVVIRGAEAENGYWQGIYITSDNTGNTFDFLDISDGGGKELTFRDGKANISIESEGKLELNDCTSARSGDCEVFLSDFAGKNYQFTNNSPAITKVCGE